jgi:hypothetical protein
MPRTKTRKCGNQSAYQSLITDVQKALPPAMHDPIAKFPPCVNEGAGVARSKHLTMDIRTFAPAATKAALAFGGITQ